MAFLSGTFLGYSTMQYQPPIPSLQSYTKLTIYGVTNNYQKYRQMYLYVYKCA